MSDEERAALGYLSGEALEKAKREARWIDPVVSEARIVFASHQPGAHIKPRLLAESKTSLRVVQPWEKPDVADAARRRGGEKNRRKVMAEKGKKGAAARWAA